MPVLPHKAVGFFVMCIKVHGLALIGSMGNCGRVFVPGLNDVLNCRTTCVAVRQKARLQRPGIISELEG